MKAKLNFKYVFEFECYYYVMRLISSNMQNERVISIGDKFEEFDIEDEVVYICWIDELIISSFVILPNEMEEKIMKIGKMKELKEMGKILTYSEWVIREIIE
jgi:hypothetical protein